MLATIVAVLPHSAAAVDEPAHKVLLKEGKFELRQYEPMLVAEVNVTGNMGKASSKGFRSLADFIFGNNKPAEKIEMTAPVTQTASNKQAATKIEMTAPVTRIENDDDTWTVTFVMPSKWTKESLPQPTSDEVSIREVSSEVMASIKFSGKGGEASHRKNQKN